MTEGKCPDCYGDKVRHIEGRFEDCRTCGATGLVPYELLAQREAEYRAWLRKRKKVKA